jgi:hypothetical protein
MTQDTITCGTERAAKRLKVFFEAKGCTVTLTKEGAHWYLAVNTTGTAIRVGR